MEKEIGKINKNDQTDIIVRIDDFGGRTGLTIREFVTSDRYTGFTKSGVRILAADIPKLKEMINSISEKDLEEPEALKGETPTEAPSEESQPKATKDQEQLPDY